MISISLSSRQSSHDLISTIRFTVNWESYSLCSVLSFILSLCVMLYGAASRVVCLLTPIIQYIIANSWILLSWRRKETVTLFFSLRMLISEISIANCQLLCAVLSCLVFVLLVLSGSLSLSPFPPDQLSVSEHSLSPLPLLSLHTVIHPYFTFSPTAIPSTLPLPTIKPSWSSLLLARSLLEIRANHSPESPTFSFSPSPFTFLLLIEVTRYHVSGTTCRLQSFSNPISTLTLQFFCLLQLVCLVSLTKRS